MPLQILRLGGYEGHAHFWAAAAYDMHAVMWLCFIIIPVLLHVCWVWSISITNVTVHAQLGHSFSSMVHSLSYQPPFHTPSLRPLSCHSVAQRLCRCTTTVPPHPKFEVLPAPMLVFTIHHTLQRYQVTNGRRWSILITSVTVHAQLGDSELFKYGTLWATPLPHPSAMAAASPNSKCFQCL